MGLVRAVLVAMAGGWLGVGVCGAQRAAATDPLEHGRLVVWVVQPEVRRLTADQVRSTLHTATAGSFGRAAGEVGQNAGSYGVGLSGLPTLAPSQTAGQVGQTAGSFGEGLSTIADAGAAATAARTAGVPEFEAASLGPRWESFAGQIRSAFPDLALRVVAVSAADLQERFSFVGRGVAQPDLLLSASPLAKRGSFLEEVTLASLGTAPEGEHAGSLDEEAALRRNWLLVAGAQHPEEARAFVVWLQDGMRAHAERNPMGDVVSAPVQMAVSAVQAALGGGVVEEADPEMAKVPAGAVRWSALTPPGREAEGAVLRTDVLAGAANERFAVYRLRVIVSTGQGFGVVHPVVVLRRGLGGAWGVLQLSGNVAIGAGGNDFALLRPYARVVAADRVRAAQGVKLAIPVDGDVRAGMPELWWDDPGDSRLLLVEWQGVAGDTHLQYVPDDGTRLQVRVPAAFGGGGGAYRWRVWAMGAGGVVTLSPWRRFTAVL